MLELKNIQKTYATKKGVSVHALNDVSIVFGETGLVFVTGKSGSGKSTLLNLIGGLDTYDTGDMIINQKSSQTFKQKDFDSYRNTMVGFIFQEYNILNEFSVAQNIGLALSLQGQKVTDEAINDLLIKLDIEGLGNRSPNELSGGQKQRVAIARALVKDPRIILADEPTGALDSTTGIQLLETLKKLSKDRLVIIISHDLEFARKYADRIINFKDGQVEYDITYTGKSDELNSGLELTNEGIVVPPKYQLTAIDLEVINNYLANKQSSTSIKHSKQSNFQGFDVTDQRSINVSSKSFSLIKSKLPFKASFLMALNALTHKKLRLIFSIILSSIALILFGTVDTLSNFSAAEKSYEVVKNENYNHVVLSNYQKQGLGWIYYNRIDLDQASKLVVESTYNGVNLLPQIRSIYSMYLGNNVNFDQANLTYFDEYWYQMFTEMDDNYLLNSSFELYGELPTTFEEVVIPKLAFEQFQLHGYKDSNQVVTPINDYNDIIGKHLNLDPRMQFKVVGVIDYKIPHNFDVLKNQPKVSGDSYNQLYWEFVEALRSSTLGMFVMKPGYHAHRLELASRNVYVDFLKNGDFVTQFYGIHPVQELDSETIVYAAGINNNNIGTYDIIIDSRKMREMVHRVIDESDYLDIRYNYLIENYYEALTLILQEEYPMYETIEDIPESMRKEFVHNELRPYIMDPHLEDTLYQVVTDFYLENYGPLTYDGNIRRSNNQESIARQIRIVGYTHYSESFSNIFTSNELFNEAVVPIEPVYNGLIVETTNLSRNYFSQMIGQNLNMESEYKVAIADPAIEGIVDLSRNVYSMQQFFFWTAVILASFAGLLMFSFISSSVSYKKQEIGILRAIGASSYDVLGIFSKQTFMISTINAIISIIGTIFATTWINNAFNMGLRLPTTLFDFGIRQVFLVTLLSMVIGYLSSALPVLKTASKKPIDAIKDK